MIKPHTHEGPDACAIPEFLCRICHPEIGRRESAADRGRRLLEEKLADSQRRLEHLEFDIAVGLPLDDEYRALVREIALLEDELVLY